MKPMCSIAHFVIIELLAYLFECNYRIIMAIWRYGDMAIRLDIIRCDATDSGSYDITRI